jgi:hypothetical protein
MVPGPTELATAFKGRAVAVDQVLGLARDLLSPDMRLRQLVAGGAPYKWIVEYHDGTSWRPEFVHGLLIFNIFGRRSTQTFQNHQLRGRLRNSGDTTPSSEST